MRDFEGRVAVVTGGGSGIGEGMALAFADVGMHVVVADIEAEAGARVCESVEKRGVRALAVETDVSQRDSVTELARRTYEEFGAAHLVCNNAGVCIGGAAHEASDEDWEWVFQVNVDGVIHGCQEFIPRLIEQGGESHIVNTSSIGGFLPGGDILGVYTASKSAVIGISESYAISIEPHGIGLSILCPGFVTTNLIDAERNRPAALGQRPGNLENILGPGFKEAMPPSALGEWVVRGVRDNQRYIFTHPDMQPLVEARFERVIAGFEWAAKQQARLDD
jgi:NAD(P)-dependent dehydrogenase (short-subunit alcohol dehydrogenase family)